MTKRTLTTLVAALSSVVVLGCSDYNFAAPAHDLEVTPRFNGVLEGQTLQLTATYKGEPADVTWTSDDESILVVSPTGLVTGVAGPGTTAAIAHLVSDPNVTASSSITVIPAFLTSGVPITNLASNGPRDSFAYFKVEVPEGTTNLTVTFTDGTGDGDLVMLYGAQPDFDNNDCASYNGGNDEECSIDDPTPGTWYIGIALWDPYAGATLEATLTP